MFLGIQMPKMAVFRPPNQTLGLTHCKCDSPKHPSKTFIHGETIGMADRLKEQINAYCAENKISGVIRVTKNDRVMLQYAIGFADAKNKTPFTDKSIYTAFYGDSDEMNETPEMDKGYIR